MASVEVISTKLLKVISTVVTTIMVTSIVVTGKLTIKVAIQVTTDSLLVVNMFKHLLVAIPGLEAVIYINQVF